MSRGDQIAESHALNASGEQNPSEDQSRDDSGGSRQLIKGLVRINRRVLDVEDYIIDCLASEQITYVRGAVRNPLLKDPFKVRPLFYLEGDSLAFNLKIDVKQLEGALATRSNPICFERLQRAFIDVIRNRGEFLTRFGKYIYRPDRSLLHGVASFLLFLSGYFKKKYVTFIFEFVTILMAELSRQYDQEQLLREELARIINSKKNYWDVVEQQFFGILGNTKELFLRPRIVVETFFDYLVFNDFFGHESHGR